VIIAGMSGSMMLLITMPRCTVALCDPQP
jgi:hypothetical protein